MGKSSPPKPPDPADTIKAQSQANLSGAMANNAMSMVNQQTPYGSLTYDQTGSQFIPGEGGQTYWQGPNGEIRNSAPSGGGGGRAIIGYKQIHNGYDDETGDRFIKQPIYGESSGGGAADGWSKVTGQYVPQYTATQTLSPAQQQMLDYQNEAGINLSRIGRNQSGAIEDMLSKPFDTSGMTSYADVPDAINLTEDYSADRQRVEDALMQRLNSQFDKDRSAMETRLANQGIRLGGEAYGSAQDDFSRGLTDARLGAILAAGDEQSRMQADNRANRQTEFNSEITAGNFQNSRRGSELNEAAMLRSMPINEITALFSGSQVQNPSFVNTPTANMPTTDAAGIINNAYNQRLGAWQTQQAQTGGTLGGLFQLGGTLGAGALMGPGAGIGGLFGR